MSETPEYAEVMESIVVDEVAAAHQRLVRSMTQGVWMDIQRQFRAIMDIDGADLLTNPDAPDVLGHILLLGSVERIHHSRGNDEEDLIKLGADVLGLIIRRRLQKQARHD